jgi:hypothetical protein
MRTVSGTAFVLAALLATVPAHAVHSQIGGLIKKKAAEAVKGKADKPDDASTAATDSCGPLTPQKVQDLLRGLQAEATARNEFNSMVAKAEASKAESDAKSKACRDAENGGPTMQKMLTDGFTGSNPPSTAAAVQEQMAKNKAKWEEYLDKKCGKAPGGPAPTYDQRDAYKKAHADGAKAAGMSEYCYDVAADRVIAFCGLGESDQKAAAQKGVRVKNWGDWLFTADEAKAIQPHCKDLMPLLKP